MWIDAQNSKRINNLLQLFLAEEENGWDLTCETVKKSLISDTNDELIKSIKFTSVSQLESRESWRICWWASEARVLGYF